MTKKREERLRILTQTDLPLWEAGVVFAGMDEAGRGPLAGNVVAACVAMPKAPLPAYRSRTSPPAKNWPRELNKDSLTLSLVGRVFWLLRVNKFRLAYFPEMILT